MEGFLMTYSEFLKSKNIKINVSALKIKHMLEAYSMDPQFLIAFKNLFAKRDDEDMTAQSMLNFITDNLDALKAIEGKASIDEVIIGLFTEVMNFKTNAKTAIKAKKAKDAVELPDYVQKYEYSSISIFESVFKCKPNKHDRDFFANFLIVDNMIAYVHDNTVSMIKMDLNNEQLMIGVNEYSKDDSLYAAICKDLSPKYEAYMNSLKSKLAVLSTEDINESIESGDFSPIENIFINDIPSCFRHIVDVKACYKTLDKTKILDKYVVKPINAYGSMKTLEFTEFLTYLTKHFKSMTAGCLNRQDRYYTWSNDLSVKSVSTWQLPTEEEWKNAKMPENWKQFLDNKASARLMLRVYYYLGALQDAKNRAQQALVISDEGQTGKGTLVRLLSQILPKNSIKFVTNSCFAESDRFGFSTLNIEDAHIVAITEYDGKSLCTNKGKAAIGGDDITLDVKNRSSITWHTEGVKFIITSNEGCALKEHSYRRRIIPVSFKLTHSMKDNFTDEQLKDLLNTGKDFLNYCYKIYQECPYRSKSGEYLVMCPEHEQEYLKSGTLPDDKLRLIKAFSKDDEISQFFDVGDFDDYEDNVEFTNVFNAIFEYSEDENDRLTSIEVSDAIYKYIMSTYNAQNESEYNDLLALFDIKRYSFEVAKSIDRKTKQWWKWSQYLLNQGCRKKKFRKDDKVYNGWTNLKLKPAPMSPKDKAYLEAMHETVKRQEMADEFTKSSKVSKLDVDWGFDDPS
jgi:hypothetical protein